MVSNEDHATSKIIRPNACYQSISEKVLRDSKPVFQNGVACN